MIEKYRKQVYWALQKYSSYTAWAALSDTYAEFAKAYEYAIEHSGETDEETNEWDRGHLKRVLDGQIAFEKGLPRLREGQRSVFRNRSTGYLRQAAMAIVFIDRIMDPQEFDFDWMKNKEEVVDAANELSLKSRGLILTTELDEDEERAALICGVEFDDLYAPFNYPPQLPDVPAPTDTTRNTSEEISITGIWEPEWEIPAGLLKTLTGTAPKVEKGCMNYLLTGSIAPKYQDGPGVKFFDVRWRLIWADHRYEDGIIPETEKEYLLETQPQPASPSGRLRGLPSEIVPQTGWWHTPALKGAQGFRYFEQGQRFPETRTTDYGGVIWNYDPDQQKDPPQK